MPAPTNPFLTSFNSNIDSLVTSETEVVTVTMKQMFNKSRSFDFVQNFFARMLVRDTIAEQDPFVFMMESINGIPVSNPELVTVHDLFPKEIPNDHFVVSVTYKMLMNKSVNKEEAIVNLLRGDNGDVAKVNEDFVTQMVKEGSCPIPVAKITDITVL